MRVEVVENGVQAVKLIDEMVNQGFARELIYLFALNETRAENLTHWTATGDMGLMEVGFGETIENFFRPRDRELYSLMTSLGISDEEAFLLENELEAGRIVIVGVQN